MMFYIADVSGGITGPHLPGVVKSRLAAREMRWEDMVCLHGSGGWVPASVYEKELSEPPAEGPAPAVTSLACRTCGSGQIQKVSLTYETGTSHGAAAGRFAPPEMVEYNQSL
jgi:hypothetical protein